MRFLLQFLVLVSLSSPLWAGLETGTHGYFVSKKNDCVMAVNLTTGEETKITVNRPISMLLYGNKGYVTCDCHEISVIDLNTHTVIQHIQAGRQNHPMVIYKDHGYVSQKDESNDSKVVIIDLNTDKVTGTIMVDKDPQSMGISGNRGYIIHPQNKTLTTFNLDKNLPKECLDFLYSPSFLTIYENNGYIGSHSQGKLTIIDLKTLQRVGRIDLQKPQNSMMIYKNKGYVLSMYSPVTVIDLTTNEILKEISAGDDPQSMILYNNKGYVVDYRSMTISVVNLDTDEVCETLINAEKEEINLCGPYVYLGLQRIH